MIAEKTLDLYDAWLRQRAENDPETRVKYLSSTEARMLRTYSSAVSEYTEQAMHQWLESAQMAERTKKQYSYAILRFLGFVSDPCVKWNVCTLSAPPCTQTAEELICCRDCINFADCEESRCQNDPERCGCALPRTSMPPEAGDAMMPRQKYKYARATPEKVAFIKAHHKKLKMSTMMQITGLSRSTIQNVLIRLKHQEGLDK